MSHKSALAALALSAGTLLAGGSASASVVDVFTVTPGGSGTTLDVQLSLSADSGYFNAQFSGGTVTFDSDFGPSTTLSIPSGGNFQDLSTSFTYPAGIYAPDFSAVVDYTEQFQEYVYLYSYQYVIGTYGCGFLGFDTCYEYGTQNVYGWETFTADEQQNLNGSADLFATPIPAALPLFAGGLGLIGAVGWRRKRNAAIQP